MRIQLLLMLIMTAIALASGCATAPSTGGWHGDVSRLGTPGEVLAEINVGEGMLVETVPLDEGRPINLQINKKEVPKHKPLYPRVLTIGRFSTVLGSGFARPENIYYSKRIDYQGRDYFETDGRRYLVTWRCDHRHRPADPDPDIYSVRIQRLYPPAESPPAPGKREQ
ncbi:MAG: hypothetical protein AB1724_13385 [Thermodesulfobacteriota bacterium]